ncbi:uncharacterized protein BJ212DRAFT_1219946, partial [Suillus subaureus]
CVTGLTVRHIAEIPVIKHYYFEMLHIFTSHPFYTTHIHLPVADAHVSSMIRNNPKCWPYFWDAIGAIDGS